jgi:photosystem II stability/assembly factor-like uncharacterized protein
MLVAVAAPSPLVAWAVGYDCPGYWGEPGCEEVVVRTIDGGATWTRHAPGIAASVGGDVAAASGQTAWVVGPAGAVRFTEDGGATWRTQATSATTDLTGVSAASRSTAWTVGAGGAIPEAKAS